jgi:hypothetical protein
MLAITLYGKRNLHRKLCHMSGLRARPVSPRELLAASAVGWGRDGDIGRLPTTWLYFPEPSEARYVSPDGEKKLRMNAVIQSYVV